MTRTTLKQLTYRTARRIVVAVVGATLLLLGIVLVFTPGPAILVLTLALLVLAAEFAWARRWLHKLRRAAANGLGSDRARERLPQDRSTGRDGDGCETS